MSQPQQQKMVDNDASETAIKLMHHELYRVMKKTKATFNDSVIEKLVKDVDRYCSVPESLRKNSDDRLNVFIMKSSDIKNKRYGEILVYKMDALIQGASFSFTPGVKMSNLIIKASSTGNTIASRILDLAINEIKDLFEVQKFEYKHNTMRLFSITEEGSSSEVRGFIGSYKTTSNCKKFISAFADASVANAYRREDRLLKEQYKSLSEKIEELKEIIDPAS